ncbi:MAG TPA: hemolysin III family protein [Thermoanaerobaculia bacterium]|nr:hemolysin III family protein [Thermoanaerobaculia bacterium]
MEHASVPCETSLGEEIASSITHGVGLVAAVVGAPILVMVAARRGAGALVGAAVFVATVIVLYAASTLYHAIPHEKAKRVFKVLDRAAIFLLIAGSYTPFTLTALRGAWGFTLLATVWALATLGVTLTATGLLGRPALSTSLYLGMGWLAVIVIQPLWRHLPAAGFAWLVAGGLAYTAGVPFFAARRLRYGHVVWHLFVLAGTVCHYVAVLGYAV